MRTKIGLVTILFLVIATFIGCAREKSQIEGKETVVFMVRGGADIDKSFIEVANNFMKVHPEIIVKSEVIPDQYYFQKVLTAIAGGSPPDVICMTDDRTSYFAEKGAISDLSSFLAKDKEIDMSRYYPISLKMFQYKGNLYALPYDLGFYLMFYNKNLFDAISLPYPKSDWTWDDYLELAKKLTKDTNGDGKIDQYGTNPYLIIDAIHHNGGAIFDDIENPTRCVIDSPEAIEAIQFCIDLYFKHHVCPTPTELVTQSLEDMFMTGRLAMSLDGHWRIPIYKNIKAFKWAVIELPMPKGKKKFLGAGGGGFSICKGTKHPEATWKLLKYLAGPKGQEVLIRSGLIVPSLEPLANSPLFLVPPPEDKKPFIKNIPYFNWYNYKTSKWLEINDILHQELEFSRIGQRSVPETCSVIVKKLNALLSEK